MSLFFCLSGAILFCDSATIFDVTATMVFSLSAGRFEARKDGRLSPRLNSGVLMEKIFICQIITHGNVFVGVGEDSASP